MTKFMLKRFTKEKIIMINIFKNTNKERTITVKGVIKNILMITEKGGKILGLLRIRNLLHLLL